MAKQPARTPNLFAAAGLDRDAPRPLADKLRPETLADVVGQDHLLGPDGAPAGVVLPRRPMTRAPGEYFLASGRRA